MGKIEKQGSLSIGCANGRVEKCCTSAGETSLGIFLVLTEDRFEDILCSLKYVVKSNFGGLLISSRTFDAHSTSLPGVRVLAEAIWLSGRAASLNAWRPRFRFESEPWHHAVSDRANSTFHAEEYTHVGLAADGGRFIWVIRDFVCLCDEL